MLFRKENQYYYYQDYGDPYNPHSLPQAQHAGGPKPPPNAKGTKPPPPPGNKRPQGDKQEDPLYYSKYIFTQKLLKFKTF